MLQLLYCNINYTSQNFENSQRNVFIFKFYAYLSVFNHLVKLFLKIFFTTHFSFEPNINEELLIYFCSYLNIMSNRFFISLSNLIVYKNERYRERSQFVKKRKYYHFQR